MCAGYCVLTGEYFTNYVHLYEVAKYLSTSDVTYVETIDIIILIKLLCDYYPLCLYICFVVVKLYI